MRKLIFLFLLLFSSFAYSQMYEELLTPSDRIIEGLCQGDWLEIVVVDSATSDTVYYEEPNGDGWIGMAIKDLTTDEIIESGVIIPGVGTSGKKYLVWRPYPRSYRVRLSSYSNSGMWVRTFTIPR